MGQWFFCCFCMIIWIFICLTWVGQWSWKCCEAPEALRSSGRRQARSAQPLCRGERSPIHRAPTGRKSVGQWCGMVCILRLRRRVAVADPRSRPWVIRSGLTASASRFVFLFSADVWDTIWRFFTRIPSACFLRDVGCRWHRGCAHCAYHRPMYCYPFGVLIDGGTIHAAWGGPTFVVGFQWGKAHGRRMRRPYIRLVGHWWRT